MTKQMLFYLLPVLGFLGYAVVTGILTVAANQYRTAIELHDRMCASREMRRQYLESLKVSQTQTKVAK